ncbi:hypothetical protein HPB48_005275 [Haemaphysalis longicornis]|uniref:Uncharacterized protein n=1 Tax=Haemaphysalis longicornis TaxID=44386 RepID=A0A9J6H3J4_HAELO|nr:hypothetical protein HPB48_005275 [Haemaphysalis longicornis]
MALNCLLARKDRFLSLVRFLLVRSLLLVLDSVGLPGYLLQRVRVPVALYQSPGDWYADPRDVARLRAELPNVVHRYTVPERQFTHYDFVVGTGAAEVLYGEMIRFMDRYRYST